MIEQAVKLVLCYQNVQFLVFLSNPTKNHFGSIKIRKIEDQEIGKGLVRGLGGLQWL
jgi:hypothetical protein